MSLLRRVKNCTIPREAMIWEIGRAMPLFTNPSMIAPILFSLMNNISRSEHARKYQRQMNADMVWTFVYSLHCPSVELVKDILLDHDGPFEISSPTEPSDVFSIPDQSLYPGLPRGLFRIRPGQEYRFQEGHQEEGHGELVKSFKFSKLPLEVLQMILRRVLVIPNATWEMNLVTTRRQEIQPNPYAVIKPHFGAVGDFQGVDMPRKCAILQVNRDLRQEGRKIFQEENSFMFVRNDAQTLEVHDVSPFLRRWFGKEGTIRFRSIGLIMDSGDLDPDSIRAMVETVRTCCGELRTLKLANRVQNTDQPRIISIDDTGLSESSTVMVADATLRAARDEKIMKKIRDWIEAL